MCVHDLTTLAVGSVKFVSHVRPSRVSSFPCVLVARKYTLLSIIFHSTCVEQYGVHHNRKRMTGVRAALMMTL